MTTPTVATLPPYRLGCSPSLPDTRNFAFMATHKPVALPPTMDYRADLPPCENQGQEGSCVSFAAGAAYRFARRRRHGWPRPAVWSDSIHYGALEDFEISFAVQYWLARKLEGTTASDAGSSIADGVKVLHQYGACAWHNAPYVPGMYAVQPPTKAIINASHHEVAAYYQLDGSTAQLKQALAQGYLPIIGVVVYNSIFSVGADGILPMPQPREAVAGGHALVVCGFLPDGRFIVRNSWSTAYGSNGYIYVEEAYLNNPQLCFEVWAVSVGSL